MRPYIKIVDKPKNIRVSIAGTTEDLVKMIVRIAEKDEEIKQVVIASAMTLYYLDGMDSIEEEIRKF